MEELEKGYLTGEQCQTLLYYTFRETDTYDVKNLLEKLQNIRIYEDDIMSVAQKIEQQGIILRGYNKVAKKAVKKAYTLMPFQ